MAVEFNARQTNRLRVIQALYRHPRSSRSAVAELTGLSRPTVSAFMEELERAGIVEEFEDPTPRQSGRPPVLMALVPRAAFAVGVDMGHEHLRVATCDLSGEILSDEYTAIDVDHAPQASMDLAAELVQRTLDEAGVAKEHLIGVAMALAAPVDGETGHVFAEGILPSWGGVEPAAEMSRRLDLPVHIENDANLGALGEHRFGAGKGADQMAYVRLSAGIGLGLVLCGKAFGGNNGIAGELGHVRVSRDGPICRCGNRGCLEMVASPSAVARLLGPDVSVARLLERATSGERGAIRAVADAGELIGEALATLVTLLNPKLIVVGGDLATTGDVVLDPIRAAIARYGIPPAAEAVRVVPGKLKGRAEVLGAAALVLDQSPEALAQRLD
ncbi:ROK family transcriptional regulator [Solirubrobacter ginsenosidimutans]|uniref:ROK family transcriptional regulator n=1 Tax=Solirubrobacter ginsenosidimutans TaxID=490573 RepID=A0A9X3MWR5_9ACTN|nr:ROK family transcriptional regulator [Solirubrobacter ginsenosidimutans]MDA0164125.1 ROK family transcriptional regulator [Solirubrobacter ginsenosidimutans]